MLCIMTTDFHQIAWDDRVLRDWQALLALAIDEDIGHLGDVTTRSLVAENVLGRAAVVARQRGIVAGLPGATTTLAAIDSRLCWTPRTEDGQTVDQGGCVGTIEGPVRGLFASERILLNFLGRLSGIATLTRQYVDAVATTNAHVYDTRKTTPGWRRLEKYAVRCGGGRNHRAGLDQAILIKDNHLAIGTQAAEPAQRFTSAEAVARARQFVAQQSDRAAMLIEVEVDTLVQLDAVLPARPDIVLLDNMTPNQLCEAVVRRNAVAPAIQLEASGRVNLGNVRQIAQTGVERISVGALTHSAVILDYGLDWA